MGDSSGGPDNSHEAMDFVSNPYKRANIEEPGAEFKTPSKTSVSTRGRTKTNYGAYAGLAAAKAKLRSSQEEFEVQAEKMKSLRLEFPSLRSKTRSRSHGNNSARDRSPVKDAELVSPSDITDDEGDSASCPPPKRQDTGAADRLPPEDTSAVDVARKAAQTVLAEAAKSANLNGVVRGNINAACREIIEAMEFLANRSESDELKRLKADNRRMREQLAQLASETKALRTAFAERKTAVPASSSRELPDGLEEILAAHSRELSINLGNMINARIEAIESRLPPEPIMRPPLAADRANRAQPVSQPAVSNAGPRTKTPKRPTSLPRPELARQVRPDTPVAGPSMQNKPQTKDKPQPKKQTRVEHQPPSSQPLWTEVVGRKAKKASKQTYAETTAAAKKKRPAAVRIPTAPKSSAVVVTIKPDAEVTYLAALQKVTSSLKLAEVGVESVRVRRSATGARLIEIPGAGNDRVADELAAKIEGIIGDVATVHRPTKTADLRVTGFDESVTAEDVRTAVVLKTGCAADQVKVGPIRLLPNGSGSVLMRCPVTTAGTLVKAGKILVGWSAAHIKALDPQPMRCYRCMGTGHTRALCPSPVDRGDLCFRCSKPGHRASQCEAEPFCSVCKAAKRPAGHVMGGHACAPPGVKGRNDIPKKALTDSQPAQAATEGQDMDI